MGKVEIQQNKDGSITVIVERERDKVFTNEVEARAYAVTKAASLQVALG